MRADWLPEPVRASEREAEAVGARRLAETLRDAAAGNAAINAPRVWATMLAVALLERQRFCWLWVRCMLNDRVATHSFDASRCASIAGRWRCVSRG